MHNGQLIVQSWTVVSMRKRNFNILYSLLGCVYHYLGFVQYNTQDLINIYMAFGPISQKKKPNQTASSFSQNQQQQARQIFGKIIKGPKITIDHIDILVVSKNLFHISVYTKCVLAIDYRLALEIFKHLNEST